MKKKLFCNVKRITTMFSVAILCMTLTTLLLRLTVFSDLAAMAAPQSEGNDIVSQPEDQPGSFSYSISRNVYFATPQSRGDFRIMNPETNENYMTVAVIRPETGENLLYTGFIKPGESRNDMLLQIQLPEGVYECIAEITARDPVTFQTLGSEQWDITLYIGVDS